VGTLELEAIILAGGLATRLSSVISDRPKAMVDVAGRPFLEILLDRIAINGVARAILATGHMHNLIEAHFGSRQGDLEILYSVENHPLGTGGAVWQALKLATRNDVLVINGDTLFDVDLQAFYRFHRDLQAGITLALKPMQDFDRYGTVELKEGRIVGFREKTRTDKGLINGGIYLLDRRAIEQYAFPEVFSLEHDLLEKKLGEITVGGFVHNGYFIDIGVPEDLIRARQELPLLF
jgi:D-glycero-alpha-D-manno-heptose 1-phosphate guanylyltransferase